MLELYIIATTTMIATVGPQDVAVLFAVLSKDFSQQKARRIALRGVLIASGIIFLFAFFGEALLNSFGISLAALQVAGGILLLLMSIDMVFARPSGATAPTSDEQREAKSREDISVFPLAMPLIAGPGTMGSAILLMTKTQGVVEQQIMVLLGISSVLLLTYVLLLLAGQVKKILGVTGMHVIGRVFGILLAGLAVQFIFDGMSSSGLI